MLKQGKRIQYVPEAYATEYGSLNLSEEWKCKVRIGAGGIQSTLRSFSLANPWRFGWVSYTYLIHRVARWTIANLALLISLLTLPYLAFQQPMYIVFLGIELLVLMHLLRSFFLNKSPKNKVLKILVYFVFMNLSVVAGWLRFAKGSQTVLWDRAKRAA